MTRDSIRNRAARPVALRRCALAAALLAALLAGGCDDSVQEGGVGASVGLPNAFTDGPTNTPDIGVGNVHWVGNPRW